jgi:hypothetical protein
VLDRPPPPADAAARQRERRRRWQADYRQRQRQGTVLAEVPAVVIELLIVARWLAPEEAHDKRRIKSALEAFGRSSLKNLR